MCVAGQHLGASETADGADSRGRRAPLCPQCLSRHQGRSDSTEPPFNPAKFLFSVSFHMITCM